MDPAIWETLQRELLLLVFARLPVSEICQLRLLSQDWKRAIDTHSEFTPVLEESVYPNMFGLVTRVDSDEFWGRIFDVKSDQWHDFLIDFISDSDFDMEAYGLTIVDAADGGLICLVNECTDESPLVIIVMNPLTKKWVELPSLPGIVDGVRPIGQPTMVQLFMDSQRPHYNVLVVGYTPSPQVYDSKTKGWTVVGPRQQSWDRIYGIEYRWHTIADIGYGGDRHGPCVYDFVEGRLQDFGGSSIVNGPLVMDYAVLKNRLFVLHTQARADPANLVPANDLGLKPNYYISEYHLQKNAREWVKVETHNCSSFDDCSWPDYRLLIQACNGFLMVFAQAEPPGSEQCPGWLYDLSSHEWRRLPALEDDLLIAETGPIDLWDSLVYELRWDAVP